jgi:epoxyqueuosine reductase QueG
MTKNEAASTITRIIKDYISSSNNSLNEEGEPAWGDPLVRFSSGSDQIYEFYKSDIGSFYLTPIEIFKYSYPKLTVEPIDLTVVSWILPHTERTKADNRKRVKWPSERWARARIMGEAVNMKLRKYIDIELAKLNMPSISPLLSPLWHTETSQKYSYASTWSERHAAFAAGLGTFGLSDGLITPIGKAHRVGSTIAKVRIDPTPRPYKGHHEYCLFFSNGSCGECIKKCPAGAISVNGHDKKKCSNYVDSTNSYVEKQYHFKGYGCGLCQVGVPCESRIPKV